MRADFVEGFVLHARDYRDSSQLVDIFTQNYGRIRLVARGSRSRKKDSHRLAPFHCALFSWSGKGELKTLTGFESIRGLTLQSEKLICGFYINELLWHLLQPEDSHPHLYQQYAETLNQLNSEQALEPVLRNFELNLLEEVGYGISFDHDTQGEAIQADKHYRLDGEAGWTAVGANSPGCLGGDLILAIAGRDFSQTNVRNVCKRLNRQAIDDLLEGRKLHSRELIIAQNQK